MFNIGPITDNLLNSCIIEFRKENNKEKIFKNIIDPLLVDISLRYYPYFILFPFSRKRSCCGRNLRQGPEGVRRSQKKPQGAHARMFYNRKL